MSDLQGELDALRRKNKDLKARNKTDLDIKENQVRALKAKIEQLTTELDQSHVEITNLPL